MICSANSLTGFYMMGALTVKWLKDIRNLFDQNDDDIYGGIEYLFDESIIIYGMKQNGLEYEEIKNLVSTQPKEVIILHEIKQNGLEYEEIKKLMSIQSRKENCENVSFISGRTEKEEVIECKVICHEVNYEYEHVKKVDCIKQKPCLIDHEYIMGEIVEIIEEKKADCIKSKSCLIDCEYIAIEEEKVEGQKLMKRNGLEYDEIKR